MFERLLRETGAYKPSVSKDVGSGPRYCVQLHLPTLVAFLKANMPGFEEPTGGFGADRSLGVPCGFAFLIACTQRQFHFLNR